ncbi:ATP-binding protein [Microbispora sp. NBC_01389]|uniref:ATP-binding protein n=1 Tax=Microbispora sp. NBC_01389 TaxID=2903584 RepID=UPI00386D22BA
MTGTSVRLGPPAPHPLPAERSPFHRSAPESGPIMRSPFSPASGRVSEELPLAARPAVISRARHFVRSIVTRWQLSDMADDVELLTSEVVTNAVQATEAAAASGHRSHLVVLRARLTREHLYVEVWDGVGIVWPTSSAPGGALPGEEDDIAECGRGLVLVESLSHAWGVLPGRPDGKVVWFSIALPRARRPVPLPTATTPAVARRAPGGHGGAHRGEAARSSGVGAGQADGLLDRGGHR